MIISISKILDFIRREGIKHTFEGDISHSINGFSSLFKYKSESMTFVVPERNLSDYLNDDCDNKISLIIMSNTEKPDTRIYNIIRVEDPRMVFFKIVDGLLCKKEKKNQETIGKNTYISSNVKIGKNVVIGNNCVIDGDVLIGNSTIIGNNVTIENKVCIGERCEILSGAVIGTDGFGFQDPVEGKYELLRHYGGVFIGNDVRISSNTVVNRGMLDDTTVKDGTKIDTLCHIAHNVVIDENCLIIAGSTLYGSSHIEHNSRIATAIVVNQGIVGENSIIGMGGVVTKNIPANSVAFGNPAIVKELNGDKNE